ncbi:putative pilus assembly protein [Thauera aromatica K172]|uniref:Putative pilus assembly protein n=1 Tax=Thauera aromatica K172 TaxID=44139 RepID=A0A2R4BLB1_THAAR|nr:putative pilus assembly protein [Thauera aromatica K172]
MKSNMTRSLKASLIALSIAAIPFAVQGAGLGQISVFSALGQPLRAQIPVSATPQELRSLNARIASPEAFRQAQLGYGSAARSIRLRVDTGAAGAVIHLSSERPINDPFVDLLVELNWDAGRLVREYTFLLDPVDFAAPSPLAAAVEAPLASPSPRPPLAAAPSAPTRGALPSTHAVRRGETLYRIAVTHLQPGMTLDQMLVALYRTNPDAFAEGNINRLRAGAVLSLPAADTVRAIGAEQAQREIRAQSADFDAYRRGLAAAVEHRAPAPAPADEQVSAGRIVPRVDARAAGDDNADQLHVSRSRPAGAGEAEARLQALEEELGSRERSLDEAAARLALLESSIRGLQRLLELQNGTMGSLQEQAAPAAAETREGPAGANREPVPVPAAAGAEVAGSEAARAAKVAPAPAPASAQSAPPSGGDSAPGVLDAMLGDSKMLAGAAAILVLLLAYAGLGRRRRQAEARRAGAGEEGAGDAVFSGSGGHPADAAAASIMNTDFGRSGLASIDTDEGVDPVAEADVYMAYGRDVQAEEILQDALKTDPKRAAIHLKLLEIHAQRGDPSRFGEVAGELFAVTAGRGRDWDKAAALGRKLDPKNPRYREPAAETAVTGERGGAPAVAAAGGGVLAAQVVAGELSRLQQDVAGRHALDFAEPAPASPAGDGVEQGGGFAAVPRGDAQEEGAMASSATFRAGAPDAVSAAAPALPVEAQVEALDFDLGSGVPAVATARGAEAQAEAERAAAVPEEPALEFDFDLDFGTGGDAGNVGSAGDAAEPGRGAQERVGEAGAGAALDFELPDLDLELDAPQPWAVDMNATVVCPDDAAEVFEGGRPSLAATGDAPFDPVAAPRSAPTSGTTSGTTSADRRPLDSGFSPDAPAPVAPSADTAPELDLGTLDLELDTLAGAGISVTEIPAPDEVRIGAELADEAAARGEGDGIETKLELARAYEEMGDREGAAELLREVIGEGSAAQRSAAREMLSALDR